MSVRTLFRIIRLFHTHFTNLVEPRDTWLSPLADSAKLIFCQLGFKSSRALFRLLGAQNKKGEVLYVKVFCLKVANLKLDETAQDSWRQKHHSYTNHHRKLRKIQGHQWQLTGWPNILKEASIYNETMKEESTQKLQFYFEGRRQFMKTSF